MTTPTPEPADERYVISAHLLARILNSVDADPFRAWANLTEQERAHYEALAVSELADHGIRPIGPAAPAVRPQDATDGAGESPAPSGGSNGPQRGSEAFWPDYVTIAQHRTHEGRHAWATHGRDAWAARCWGVVAECTGWLSDHETERWAQIALQRHLSEQHGVEIKLADPEPAPPAPGDGLREEIAVALATVDTRRDEYGLGPAEYGDLAEDAEAETRRLTGQLSEYADRAIANGQRADRAEADLERLRDTLRTENQRADAAIDREATTEDGLAAAEAALARVHAECDALDGELGYLSPVAREAQRAAVERIRTALDGTDTPTETR